MILNFLNSALFVGLCFLFSVRLSMDHFDNLHRVFFPGSIALLAVFTFFCYSIFNFPVLILAISIYIKCIEKSAVHFLIILSKTTLVVSLLAFLTRIAIDFSYAHYPELDETSFVLLSIFLLLGISVLLAVFWIILNEKVRGNLFYMNINAYSIISILIEVLLIGVIIFFNQNLLKDVQKNVLLIAMLFNTCFLFHGLGIQFEKRKFLRRLHDKEKASLLEYCNQLEILLDELVIFRHDYLNFYTSLNTSIQNKNITEIETIFNQVIQPVSAELLAKDTNIHKLKNIKNSLIKSFLSVKFIEASQKGLTLTIDIPAIVDQTYIEDIEMLRILSILWENALEEAEISAEKHIEFAYFLYEANLHIILSNTSAQKYIQIDQIYQKFYSTKAKDNSRGIGLYTLRLLAMEKENIEIETSFISPIFRQEVILSPVK